MSVVTTGRARALLLVGVLVLSVIAPSLGVAATTEKNQTPSLNTQTNTGYSVSILTESVSDKTQTTIQIEYNPGDQNVSDLRLNLHGPETNTTTDSMGGLFESVTATDSGQFNTTLDESGGTVAITFDAGTFGGGELPLKTELVNETGEYTNLASSERTYQIDSSVALTDWSVSPQTAMTSEPVTVTATLSNTGSSNDSFAVTASSPYQLYNSSYVTVEPNETVTESLTFTRNHPGDVELSVSGEGPTTVSFGSPLQVQNRSVNTIKAHPGENVTLSAVVNNTGTSEESRYVNFDFGDTHLAREVTLAPGEQQTLSVNVSSKSPGTIQPYIAGEPTATVDITSQLDVVSADVNQSTITIGEQVLVSATLENPTNGSANETVEIRALGGTLSKQISVPSGENITIGGVVEPTRTGKQPILVADTWTDTSLRVDGVLEIVEGSVSINQSTVSVGDDLAVNHTYRNPSDSGVTTDRDINIWASDDQRSIHVSLAPGETRDVNVTLTPTKAKPDAYVRAGNTNLDTVTVTSPVVIEAAEYDYKVVDGESATVTYTLNNTDESNAHSRKVDVNANNNDDDMASAEQTVELAAGETRDVSLEMQMPAPGDYHMTLADGREGGIAVLSNTSGEANLTADVRDIDSVSIRNEARFYATVTNNGTGEGAELITLQRTPDGPVIEADAVLAEPGETEIASVAMEFNSTGDKTVYVNGEAVNITVTKPYVLDTNISVVEGTVPDQMPVPEGGYDRGFLNIEFRIDDRRASSYDLGQLGADHSTRFKTEMTVRDFDPDTVISTGQNIEWNATSLSENKTKITLYINPVDRSYIQDAPDFGEWGDTQRTANFTVDNFVQYRIYGDSPDSTRDYNWAEGLAISTNALRYSTPRYYETENGSRFEVKLAAPHFREDGSLNTGHYSAQIPDSVLEEWGVESPSDLEAAYTGADDTTIDITETADGMDVTIDLHYSSGTVSVGEEAAVQSVIGDDDQEETGSDPGSGSDTAPDTGTNPNSGSQTDLNQDSGSQTNPGQDSKSNNENASDAGNTTQQPTTEPSPTTEDSTDENNNGADAGEENNSSTTLSAETTSSPPTTDGETPTSASPSTPTEPGSTGGNTPGFTPLTTVFVVGLLTLVLTYRSSSSK